MAITKTSTKIIDNKSAAADDSTSLSDCVSVDLTTAIQMAIDVEMIFNASATYGAMVEVYASDDDTNWDTNPFEQFPVAVTPGATIREHFVMIPAPKYIRVKVVNLDPTYSITAINVYSIPQVVS